MSKGEHRRFTAEQKLEILREAEQPGVTVSQVCRRNALAPSVFYRWRAVAQSGSAVAPKRDGKRTTGKDDQHVRQEAEMARLRAVIAEITAENLELKKRFEVGELSRVPAESKAAVTQIVAHTTETADPRVIYVPRQSVRPPGAKGRGSRLSD